MATAQAGYLSVGCKRTDHLDFKQPILRYVRNIYGEEQVEDISSDLDEVAQLRSVVVASSGGGSSESAKDTLARYFRALCLMETRFPISRDPGHVQLLFVWLDAMHYKRKTKQLNIHLEKAAVVFNIAAMLSQEAVLRDKNTTDGCKEAAQLFQEAAGSFGKVRDTATKIESPCPTDLSNEALAIFEKLMLAQAQDCAYHKAAKDKKTLRVLARLAKQGAVLYGEVFAMMANPSLRDYFPKSWQDSIQLRSWLLDALCQQHSAEVVTGGEDIGAEIARLRHALVLLRQVRKAAKGTSFDMSSVKPLEEVVNARLTNAEKDNHSVYLVRVQAFGELPPIEGAQIVKPLQPSLFEGAQDHLFSTLVPESSAKALSRYAELLDDLVREQMSSLEEATDEARTKLKQWEMPELLDGVNKAPVSMLPEGLGRDLDEIQHGGGISYLLEVSDQVKGLRASLDENLLKVEAELDAEALQDAEQRENHGSKWTPPPSSSLTGQFRNLIASYRGNLAAAEKSDAQVQDKLVEDTEAISKLIRDDVAANLPHLDVPIMTVGVAEPQAVIANIRQALDQMNAVSADRAALEDALRERKQKDNILPKLMGDGGLNAEELFKESLALYDDLKSDIKENLERQKQLLDYLADAVNTFRETFNVGEWQSKVDQYAAQIKEKVKVFAEIRDNLGEGMRFYASLQDAVNILNQQVFDFTMTRRVQREDHMERASKGGPVALISGALQGLSRLVSPQQPQPPPPLPDQPPAVPPSMMPPQPPQEQYQVASNAPPVAPPPDQLAYSVNSMSGELQALAMQGAAGHPTAQPESQPSYQHPAQPQQPPQPPQPPQPLQPPQVPQPQQHSQPAQQQQHMQPPPHVQPPHQQQHPGVYYPPQHYQMPPQQAHMNIPGQPSAPYGAQYYGYHQQLQQPQQPHQMQPQYHPQHPQHPQQSQQPQQPQQPMAPPDWGQQQQHQAQGYQAYYGNVPPQQGAYYTNQTYPPQHQ